MLSVTSKVQADVVSKPPLLTASEQSALIVAVGVAVAVLVGVGVMVGVGVSGGVLVGVGVLVEVLVGEAVGVAVALLVGVLVAVAVETDTLSSRVWLKPIAAITMMAMPMPRIRPITTRTACLSDTGNNIASWAWVGFESTDKPRFLE